MPTSKELRERRAPIAKKIRDFADLWERNKAFTAEEEATYKTVNEDYDKLTRQIEIEERAELAEKNNSDRIDDPNPGRGNRDTRNEPADKNRRSGVATAEDRELSMQAWFRARSGRPLKKRHKEACQRTGFNPHQKDIKFRLDQRPCRSVEEARNRYASPQQRAAQSSVSGTGGAYLIAPESFAGALELAMLEFNAMRRVAETIRTATGAEMPWPSANDTGNTGALLSENTVTSEQEIAIGLTRWHAWKYTSKMIKIPHELLEDSAFNLAAMVGQMLGERLGRITDTHFTTGDGANKPTGIVPASYLGKTTAGATAITADECIDFYHSVDVAYRGPGFAFMFHDNIALALRKLKDSQNRYLWGDGLNGGLSQTFLGAPVVINNQMQSSIATATKTMLCGQFSQYKIRDVGTVRLRVLVERFADYDQVAMVAFARHDGNLLDAGTHPVKHMLQA